ncbi:MAG: hypothetical protein RBR84_02805 [Bacteroidales bacterium]|jgi:hypothetical protein|nr:hypothetical protein [Bacteroidales bacterium]MDY0084826.1 hypothetical protein [Bacteroidales bacterium]
MNYRVLSLILIICLIAAGCERRQTTEKADCDGVFYMSFDGFSSKTMCAGNLDAYAIGKDGLKLKVMKDELAGKVIFELLLNSWTGPGEYKLGGNSNKCELIVHGATDEFYKCTSGNILITEATSNKLEANFTIVIEGFYNKKVIHARGGVHL